MDIDPKGKPEGLEAGKTLRWYVWHNDNGWHVRTTTKTQKHNFHGKIEVIGGKFKQVSAAKLDDKKGDRKDWWTLSSNNRVLTLDFKTEGGMDGFDFEVAGKADRLDFTLLIDKDDEPKRIYIGKSGEHPEMSSFELPANP